MRAEEIEKVYQEVVFGFDEPDIMVASVPTMIWLSYRCGYDVPELLLPPSGPGFSAQ